MLNVQEIMEIIPHRYPFLLVDKAELTEDGAIGYKNVTMNEPFFAGHFPNHPVMPGVLQIEALAQVGAIALLSKPEYKGKIAYFGGIQKAKFRKQVVPGDTLRLECILTKCRGPIGMGKAVATVDGAVVCEAELTFAIGK